ncbi:hypothetical protein SAMN05192545_2912 [Maribacter dokdonensis]|uniref:Lipoprotein n=1 Tax=Maribacter dokdonensis TaxID=320912 RepID=A0ABY0UTK5_9FLAO|nr:hypothetical protein [Maribacter dokdonensis]SDT16265.1 hypothetical protein SAMN05192545_2912 [Maribacter dokdonensis]
MKKPLLLFAIFVSSCKPFHNVTKTNLEEEFKVKESAYERITNPGDRIVILPAPLNPINRDTIIIYKGKNGATATTSYDSDGRVSAQIIDCPETTEERLAKLDAQYKLELSIKEKELDLEIANTIGKWLAIILIPIGFFFAVAYGLRSK